MNELWITAISAIGAATIGAMLGAYLNSWFKRDDGRWGKHDEQHPKSTWRGSSSVTRSQAEIFNVAWSGY